MKGEFIAVVTVLIFLLILYLIRLNNHNNHNNSDKRNIELYKNKCQDKISECKALSLNGECEADPVKMFSLCPESCYLCDLTKKEKKGLFDFNIKLCKDFSDNCGYLTDKECTMPYNKLRCRRACKLCTL